MKKVDRIVLETALFYAKERFMHLCGYSPSFDGFANVFLEAIPTLHFTFQSVKKMHPESGLARDVMREAAADTASESAYELLPALLSDLKCVETLLPDSEFSSSLATITRVRTAVQRWCGYFNCDIKPRRPQKVIVIDGDHSHTVFM